MMDIEGVKSKLSYSPENGQFTWVGDLRHHAGAIAGSNNGHGHLFIRLENKKIYLHRIAWAFVYGEWPSDEIDHIDGNPSNNRISNLRQASHAENMLNRRRHKNNKSGFKGVSLHQSGKWVARIKSDGKYHSLGLHATPQQASAAYAAASQRLHGGFGRAF